MTKIIILGYYHIRELHRVLIREELRRLALNSREVEQAKVLMGQLFSEPISIADFKDIDEPVIKVEQGSRRDFGRSNWKFNKQRHNRGLK